MRIIKTLGRYDFCSNQKEWQVAIMGLPEGCPTQSLSECWPEDDEPDTIEMPPSEIVDFISERLESYLLNTGRKEKRETIKWLKEHSDELDSEWAKTEISRKSKLIDSLKDVFWFLGANRTWKWWRSRTKR